MICLTNKRMNKKQHVFWVVAKAKEKADDQNQPSA